jgi:DNA-directed RNA polymerase alpha subunit
MTQTTEKDEALRKMVWEMRQSGMTLDAIGKQINRSKEDVRRLECKHARLEREREERRAALHGLTVPELMHRSILDLELTARARNSLNQYRKYTIAEIMPMSDEELLSFQNFGKVTVAATRAAIDEAIANAEKVESNDH